MVKWSSYKRKLIEKAKLQKKSSDYIDRCLLYAKNLYDKGLPIIFNREHFSQLVGYNLEYIHRMSNSPIHFYRTFSIRKSSGKLREISEPLPDLKSIQKWILTEILNNIPVSAFAKAYTTGRSIKENARFHKKQNFVLNVDVKNFFPSIPFYKIKELFKEMGYTNDVSLLLSNMCCLENCLPQGAPTSPALSNIVCLNLDKKLSTLAINHKLRFTRYADDITFSGKELPHKLINKIKSILLSENLIINKEKTRIQRRNNRQEVTGIVVNEKLQVPRSMRHKLRQEIYYIKKYGVNSHLGRINETRKNYINHLMGIANYILFINPTDVQARQQLAYLRKIFYETN